MAGLTNSRPRWGLKTYGTKNGFFNSPPVPNGVNLGRMRTRRRVTLEQERRSENGDWQPICGVFGANSVPVTRFRGPRANRLSSRHSPLQFALVRPPDIAVSPEGRHLLKTLALAHLRTAGLQACPLASSRNRGQPGGPTYMKTLALAHLLMPCACLRRRGGAGGSASRFFASWRLPSA